MKTFTGNREDVAQFVDDILIDSPLDFRWITITPLATSGVYFVSIATDTSLEDTVSKVALSYLRPLTSISQVNTPGG